jgi:hypothetical protein
MKRLALCPALLLAAACASHPRPAVLGQIDAIRDSDGARESRQLAPQADARAEKLRSDAEAAWPKGQTASAEILAERALVAYSDARELARIVRAEKRLLETRAAVHQAELQTQKLLAEQQRAAAEAADLEARLRVEREAEELAELRPSTPDREQARLIAAKTALSQARLLCVSAKLLRGPSPEPSADLDAAFAELDGLETKVVSGKSPAPLREAIASRSRCQQILTTQRRPAVMANPTSEKPDQLFVELSNAGFAPSRDDRGIVVTLSGAFAGNGIEAQSLAKLAVLGRLAQSHEQTPVLVIAHAGRGEVKPIDQQRGDAAAARLKEAGANQVLAQALGGRLPIAQSKDLQASRRNERLELIFVTRL